MSESLLLICEKPSAAKNFAKALGGTSGNFEGDNYTIVSLYGHIMENPVPEKTAKKEFQEIVGGFSNIEGLPWKHTYFDFDKKELKKYPGTMGQNVLKAFKSIQKFLNQGYIPVIATDIDDLCEGDVIGHEVLNALGYAGTRYRERHVDETPSAIQKALREKVVIPTDGAKVTDKYYQTGFTRSNADFLTQSLTRAATMTVQRLGVRLPKPVPMGRLKSVILVIIGDQLKAIEEYTPSSVWESRYKLDNLILTSKDAPVFKTKDEWEPGNLPLTAKVRKANEVMGSTPPPKPFNLSSLAGVLNDKGIPLKRVEELCQKMYEDGVLSYPRTSEQHLTTEQFNEVLPKIDTLLTLLDLPKALFTHRRPRTTHVKDEGAHGALHPNVNTPSKLSDLDDTYGRNASDVYKTITERFLMMFLEDTEWVRHEYETEGVTPVFKGSVKIITKQGVTNPDEEEKDIVATTLPDISKLADLYAHEVKSTKPANPTNKWVLKQLEKNDVGTPATQVSTLKELSGTTSDFPIKDGKILSLNPLGQLGYIAAKGTKIGSVEGTTFIQKLLKQVTQEKITPEEALTQFADILAEDVNHLLSKDYQIDTLDFPKTAKRVSGTWNGQKVDIFSSTAGHEFSSEELATLFNGESVLINAKAKDGSTYETLVSLGERKDSKGNDMIGFIYKRPNRAEGVWNGTKVSISDSFMNHKFTQDELDTLFNGGSITIDGESKSGVTYNNVVLKLGMNSYKGKQFVGVIPEFPQDPNRFYGTWQGRNFSMKRKFMDHDFTDNELQTLASGGTVSFEAKSAKGNKMKVSGKLGVQPKPGNGGGTYIGFIPEFEKL